MHKQVPTGAACMHHRGTKCAMVCSCIHIVLLLPRCVLLFVSGRLMGLVHAVQRHVDCRTTQSAPTRAVAFAGDKILICHASIRLFHVVRSPRS
jgi:hypothetical protein